MLDNWIDAEILANENLMTGEIGLCRVLYVTLNYYGPMIYASFSMIRQMKVTVVYINVCINDLWSGL